MSREIVGNMKEVLLVDFNNWLQYYEWSTIFAFVQKPTDNNTEDDILSNCVKNGRKFFS